MQMQTSPNTYTIKRLDNGKYSLFDDKGEVKELPIKGEQVTAFKWLYLHDNGMIIAVHGDKEYGFNADGTPIVLEIEGEQVTAFTCLRISPDGRIRAEYKYKWYLFNPDGTLILKSN